MTTKSKYVKSDPITHILIRPDMYVGSKKFQKSTEMVWDESEERLVKKSIEKSPALLRLFIEILSNAIDNNQRAQSRAQNSAQNTVCTRKMTTIKVEVGPQECSVWNDGDVIPINKHNCEGIYNHTLIFGHLLSGSNYDDSEKRLTSGRNGLGAKLTNVFSTYFKAEGVDPDVGLKLVQVWTNNMKKTSDPQVTAVKTTKGYTKITWKTDYSQFGITELTDDMMDLYSRFVIDAAMVTGLNVYLNGKKVFQTKLNRLLGYARLIDEDNDEVLKLEDPISKVLVMSNDEYEHLSFVNGVFTRNGGKHVDAWVDAVCRPILKKLKGNLTLKDVKPYFRFIVVSEVHNPTFEGQEKHTLMSPSVTATPLTPAQVTKIMKWSIGSSLKSLKDTKELAKAIKTSKKPKVAIEGYDRANNAGGKLSKDCTLIVCEGLSAKTFTVAGIEQGLFGKKGRDWFGIFPLRGKMLNVRNASPSSITSNKVVSNLMQILGLEYGRPDKLDKMNYGKLCIITDADDDGIHIEGLILNFVDTLFPKMLDRNMVVSMKTPIIKTVSPSGNENYYFDERTYERVLPKLAKGTTTKYFKGLGTNKPKDIKRVFGMKMILYRKDEGTSEAFDTAFLQSKSTERRQWLSAYNPAAKTKTLDDLKDQLNEYSLTTFLTDDLVKFSYEDCQRSLPSAIDGFKESHRKILYAAKKRRLFSELKVAQFGGYVAEHTNYHHGEQNLFETITKMAQDFVGSNNIPLLAQEGMFGTRLEGGKDAASPRYICTRMTEECAKLFPEADDDLLKRKIDNGDLVEPEYYVPVIPMILINGSAGIGTGWSTNIPMYLPKDVKENVRRWIDGLTVKEMIPGYEGFKGTVEKVGETKFVTKGEMRVKGNRVTITELPIGLWNDKFKMWCNTNKEIIDVKDNSTPTDVSFELTTAPDFDHEKLRKIMETTLSTDNMVVFDEEGTICRVTIDDIFEMWGNARLKLYEKRKTHQLNELAEKINKTRQRISFIKMVQTGKLVLTDPEAKLLKAMKENKITDKSLLNLPIGSLSKEKLVNQESILKTLKAQEKALFNTEIESLWKNEL